MQGCKVLVKQDNPVYITVIIDLFDLIPVTFAYFFSCLAGYLVFCLIVWHMFSFFPCYF